MKRFSILSAVIAVILMATALSCTPVREADDDYYYDRAQAPARVYVDDPYRGTVVLQRDPYTGRYYEVGPYASYNYSPYSSRGSRYNGFYGRTNNNRYRANNQNTYQNTSPRQTEEQRKNWEQNREEARRKILGSKSQ